MSAALSTNVDQRLLRTTKFPPEFNQKVDMSKVNVSVIKKWITDELEKMLQDDDDVVPELVFSMIEGTKSPNIKELQISLSGFLADDAAKFSQELWKLLLSAQKNPTGIPQEMLEAKKLELIQKRLEEDKAREEAKKRQEEDRQREREMARVRERETNERARGRGPRHGRDFDRRQPRRASRSPPSRRRYDDDDYYRAPARVDSYVPSGSRLNRSRRSPSYDRSPSPPPRRRRRSSLSSRSRSPPRKRRARSPSLSRSRTPPRRRARSPIPARNRSPPRRREADMSRSPSHPRGRGRSSTLASDELMPRGKDKNRLSPARNGSNNDVRRTSSSMLSSSGRSSGKEAEESGFSFLGAARRLRASALDYKTVPSTPRLPAFNNLTPRRQVAARPENLAREAELKAILLQRRASRDTWRPWSK